MNGNFTEFTIESAALAWLKGLGYAVLPASEIAPAEPPAASTGIAYQR